jgi:hypothetical protein
MNTLEDQETTRQDVIRVRTLNTYDITIFNQFYEKSCGIKRRNWCEIFQRRKYSYT